MSTTHEHDDNDENILIKIHNQISSSKDMQQIKKLLHQYPKVLTFQIHDWGGSILLHTVCSRQPENYDLIKLFIEEGLKQQQTSASTTATAGTTTSHQNHYFSQEHRGGLLFSDMYNQTPLNILVCHNAIQTIRKLQRWTLIQSNDVINYALFDSVHSTYHVDMVRFLIQLCPECISNCMTTAASASVVLSSSSSSSKSYQQNNHRHHPTLLLYHLCDKIRDSRFLLRLLPIVIEEGMKQNIGGEYSIGGLFTIHEQYEIHSQTAADLLVGRRGQSWNILYTILRGLMIGVSGGNGSGSSNVSVSDGNDLQLQQNHHHQYHVPLLLLHGAILGNNPKHIHEICSIEQNNDSAFVRDSKGRLAIHIAAEHGLTWKDGINDIVKANVDAMKEMDPITGLPIYALAAKGEKYSLSSIYELIALNLDDFS